MLATVGGWMQESRCRAGRAPIRCSLVALVGHRRLSTFGAEKKLALLLSHLSPSGFLALETPDPQKMRHPKRQDGTLEIRMDFGTLRFRVPSLEEIDSFLPMGFVRKTTTYATDAGSERWLHQIERA
jgi:hypothetical protein